MKWYLKWFVNILMSVDQFFNALTGGDPDETISSRVGKIRRDHHGRIPWRHPLAKTIDALCEIVDTDHTLEAINDENGIDAIVKNPNHKKKEETPMNEEHQQAIMTTVKSQLRKIHQGDVEKLTSLMDEIVADALPKDDEPVSGSAE